MQAKNQRGFTRNAVPIVTQSKWYKHEAGSNTHVRWVGCSVRKLFQNIVISKKHFHASTGALYLQQSKTWTHEVTTPGQLQKQNKTQRHNRDYYFNPCFLRHDGEIRQLADLEHTSGVKKMKSMGVKILLNLRKNNGANNLITNLCKSQKVSTRKERKNTFQHEISWKERWKLTSQGRLYVMK